MAGAMKCYRLVRVGILAASAALAGPVQAQSAAGGGHRHNCQLYAEHDGYTPETLNGCYAWYLWTGGTEYMWRELARRGIVDILEIASSGRVSRADRWREFGLINDPACRQAETPDQYGLRFDECIDDGPGKDGRPVFPGEPSGVIGLRKFANPKFEPARWNRARYMGGDTIEPADADKSIEPPYLVGTTCAVCHATLNPVAPPTDPANPRSENIVGTLGNIFLREGRLFTSQFKPDNFLWHYGSQQPPGTSDTSRIGSDGIFNPNAINAIHMLAHRPTHAERQRDGTDKDVFMILKDGADSIGIDKAAIRVFVNTGMCHEYWFTLHDPVAGTRPQKPFDIEQARAISNGLAGTPHERECLWVQTERLLPDIAAFLAAAPTFKLVDAPNGRQFVDLSEPVQRLGKQAFARRCAGCHSSKRPPAGMSKEERENWFVEQVKRDDFLTDNFLSDDERKPVTLIGTNAARTLGDNATRGHLWEQFSSETYKDLPSPGTIKVYDWSKPVILGSGLLEVEIPAGGPGYYRTPSLVGVWATAPLLHTNALGFYNHDPSVQGRMQAFEDAIEKLLWPERRLGTGTIMRTSRTSTLRLPLGCTDRCERVLEFPAGTPIGLVMSTDPEYADSRWAKLREFASLWFFSKAPLRLFRNVDLILDHGHYFGSDLPDEQKKALIEYVKTF
jgi:mono/diheme cytochrome c family protein